MLWKRHIPILIVAVIGSLTLFGWFIDEPNIKAFVNDDATQWFDILASFAIFLGGFNLLKMQLQKVLRKNNAMVRYSCQFRHISWWIQFTQNAITESAPKETRLAIQPVCHRWLYIGHYCRFFLQREP